LLSHKDKQLYALIYKLKEHGYETIVPYPYGPFPYEIKTSAGKTLGKFQFHTDQERQAFAAGFDVAVQELGWNKNQLDPKTIEIMNKMDSRASHSTNLSQIH
jgi:hypothetical protein